MRTCSPSHHAGQRTPLPPRAEPSALPKQVQYAPYHDGRCCMHVQCIANCTHRMTLYNILKSPNPHPTIPPACSSDVHAQCVSLATALHCKTNGTSLELLRQVAHVLQRDVLPAVAGSKSSWSLGGVPARVQLQGVCVCVPQGAGYACTPRSRCAHRPSSLQTPRCTRLRAC